MQSPVYYYLGSVLCWGVWSLGQGRAAKYLGSGTTQILGTIILILAIPVLWKVHGGIDKLDWRGAGWLVAAQISSSLAIYWFLRASELGSTATATAVTSAYPLITILMAWALFGEKITLIQSLGAGLIISGVCLLIK